jgi:ribonucleoside-triphosphate reductase (formate)
MFLTIQKRDGRVVLFNAEKITNAIACAGAATGEFDMAEAEIFTSQVLLLAERRIRGQMPSVEDIQDIVETVLQYSPYKKTAKAYILYRYQHQNIRDMAHRMRADIVDDYLGRLDWRVNENSNMAYSLQGLNNYVSSEITKQYWLSKIYPAEVAKAHRSGDFHIHDLNILSVYCVGWDLMDLLREGFRGAVGKIESKPPRHFRSALGQIVNFFYTLQGEAAGAQAFSNIDTLLAPFIRYDNLSYAEVRQALQEFVFNINVPTRVGFQTPFTNITLDLTVPSTYASTPVIIGGTPQNELYKDFQSEMDMFNRAFLEVMNEGDAKGRVFTFPIPTYNITKDFNWDNPAIAGLWEVTAKYGIPYFANFINSDMAPEDVRSMCCRLRLDTRSLERKGGGLFGANPLTGSIGVVTINMPRLGYISQSKEEFFERLLQLMDIAKESLEIKRKVLERFTGQDLYPYAKFYLRHIKEQYGAYWTNHFSTIGIVGMNEACCNLLGVGIATKDGHAFAEKTLECMRSRLLQYQEETGNGYNLEATPAEGTAYRLARIDKQNYPDCIAANENAWRAGAPPYYTNSTHLPVGYTEDMFAALDLQDGLQARYTGGTVFHGFLGERMPSAEATKRLIRAVMQNYRLPYFTLTPTFSVCPVHGYLSGEHEYCPRCDEERGIMKLEIEQKVVSLQEHVSLHL